MGAEIILPLFLIAWSHAVYFALAPSIAALVRDDPAGQ